MHRFLCLGLMLCQIWLSVDYTASTASIFNLLTLSLDRYWSITSPLQYLGKRTRARALLLIGLAWGLSLLWVIPIFGWNYFFRNKTDVSNIVRFESVFLSSAMIPSIFSYSSRVNASQVMCFPRVSKFLLQ